MKNKLLFMGALTSILMPISIIMSCNNNQNKSCPIQWTKINTQITDTSKTKEYIKSIKIGNKKINKLFIFDIDGLPGWLLRNHKELFNNILKNSIYTYESEDDHVVSANSEPNWATLFSGTKSSDHRIYGPAYAFLNEPARHATKEFGKNPTIFYEFYKKYPNGTLTSTTEWEGLGKTLEKKLFKQGKNKYYKFEDYWDSPAKIEKIIFDNASSNGPSITNLHFSKVDDIGHKFGWGSKEQLAFVKHLGDTLFKWINRINKINNNKQDLLFAIITDHGGDPNEKTHAWIHSKSGPEWIKNVPMIFVGEGIKGRNVMQDKIWNISFASTIAELMKFDKPDFWEKPLDLNRIKAY